MTPTEPEPSAFDDQAKELDRRLRQLIGDYAALFHCYPNAEGRPSVEALEKARVLAALRVHPWRKKLAAQATTFERESLREAGVELRRGPTGGSKRGSVASPEMSSAANGTCRPLPAI